MLPKYKRVLLKLSGESLMGDKSFGFDTAITEQYAHDIKSIVEFIKLEGKAAEEKGVVTKPSQRRHDYAPLSLPKDYGFFVAFFILIGLLVGVLIFAVKVDMLKKNPELLKQYQG